MGGGVPVSANPFEISGGIFFEAEEYNGRPFYSDDSFATKTPETQGSGGFVLTRVFQRGAVSYSLPLGKGDYHVWLRCSVPGNANVRFGANIQTESDLQTAKLEKTDAQTGLYRWQKLGTVTLQDKQNSFVLGQGGIRPDCFFLTQDADFVPKENFVTEVLLAKDAPKGKLLPELRHDRKITQRPRWLTDSALRVAYAHFEWDPENTPQSWAKAARETGATCLFGVGEIPGGTLNGKLKAFPIDALDDPNFQYPPGYLREDYSWVNEYVKAGHDEELKVVIYDGAFRTLDPLLVDHPEWRQTDADGKPYVRGFGSWYSPYRSAYIDRWVQVARDSGLDGIMMDMIFTAPPGGDYSKWTVDAFKKRFGVEAPRKEDPRNLTWQRWIDFQIWTREEVMLDLTEALQAVNPEIATIVNQTMGWVFDGQEYLSSRAAQCASGLLEEMGWEISRKITPERPFAWPLQSAWQNLFLHCRTANSGGSPGYGQMWHLSGFYTRVNQEALAYSMLANGTAPAVVTGANWETMQKIWAHIAACEEPMRGATLTPK